LKSNDKEIYLAVSEPKHLPARVARTIGDHQLFTSGERVLVAVSGGADSLALLHLLHHLDLGLKLLAAYIDHGLRPAESPAERLLVAANCSTLGIPYLTESVDARDAAGNSPEAAARQLRYAALERLRQQHRAESIALGHTADDQVEEFFIRLIRGAGIKGLAGMAWRQGRLVRPLLGEHKATLYSYLRDKGLDWGVDSSNHDQRFLRNRVRHQLLPLLEGQFNPAMRRTLLQTMDILAEEEACLAAQAKEALAKLVKVRGEVGGGRCSWPMVINSAGLQALHPALARRVVESCCWLLQVRPNYPQITALLGLLATAENGAELHLADGVRAKKLPSSLVMGRPLEKDRRRGSTSFAPAIHLAIPAPGRYRLPLHGRELLIIAEENESYGEKESLEDNLRGTGDGAVDGGVLQIDQASVSFPLVLRSVLPGERFRHDLGSKKIFRYFNEKKIPVEQRPAWPLLEDRDGIIALPGLVVDLRRRVSAATKSVYTISWRRLSP
jgi:tRNA(Ile)-lysidine synthase